MDKAHRQGVVHRDLKPGNVMLTKAGAKLLDFGLAKLRSDVSAETSSVLSALPTEEKPLTEKGSIIGTFQYMAPEQLEGKDADARTDLFAFGTVLYEMVTGRKAFQGQSQASLISAIMTSDPPNLASLQPMSPPLLDHVVERCLAKAPDERWQTASDLMQELSWIAKTGFDLPAETAGSSSKRRSGGERIKWSLAGFLVAVVLSTVVWSLVGRDPSTPAPITRTEIELQPGLELDWMASIALSPSGASLAYTAAGPDGHTHLYLRRLDQYEAVKVRGTEDASLPFFSPDGEWVGFFTRKELKKVSVAGGVPLTVAAWSGYGAAWTDDEQIIFSQGMGSGLARVPSGGGTPEILTTPDSAMGHYAHVWPQNLPDGRGVLFRIWGGENETTVFSSETGDLLALDLPGEVGFPRYIPTGHLVYGVAAPDTSESYELMAVPFDLRRRKILGAPVPVLSGVYSREYTSHTAFAISQNGTLVYVPAGLQERKLTWVDREGTETPVLDDEQLYQCPRFSQDDGHIVVRQGYKLQVVDVNRGTSVPFQQGENHSPLWTPDGRRVTFSSNRSGNWDIYEATADGSDEVQPLLEDKEHAQWPGSWSPDGKVLVFIQLSPSTGNDIWLLPREGKPIPFVTTPSSERAPDFSPDGRFIVYVSDETGRDEVYVQPYPGPGGKELISTDGGDEPVWSADGRELFYRQGDRMIAVSVRTEPNLEVGKPQVLFEGPYERARLGRVSNYDVTADGQRFLMVKRNALSFRRRIRVVQNWTEELKRLVPTEN